MLHHFDPDYLRDLLNAATERYKHNMNLESNIYKSLSRIGKATVMSVQDRYEYKNKRKQHLDKIKIELPQVNEQYWKSAKKLGRFLLKDDDDDDDSD